jgi:hypothetical protein
MPCTHRYYTTDQVARQRLGKPGTTSLNGHGLLRSRGHCRNAREPAPGPVFHPVARGCSPALRDTTPSSILPLDGGGSPLLVPQKDAPLLLVPLP